MQWCVVSTYMYERNSAKILIDAQCTHTLRSNCRDHFFLTSLHACCWACREGKLTFIEFLLTFLGGKVSWASWCGAMSKCFCCRLMCTCAAALPVRTVLMRAVGRMQPPSCSFVDLLIQSYSVSQTGLNLLMKPWPALALPYCFPYCRPTDAGI